MWTDDTAVKTPILTTKYHSTYLTGGTWSPTRPGVFFTTKVWTKSQTYDGLDHTRVRTVAFAYS